MVYRIKKNLLFFFGIAVTGIASFLSNSFRWHFSKEESLIAPVTDRESFDIVPWARADGPPAGGGCFPAGSRVSTPTGDKSIESLSVGDLVYGFDTDTGLKTTSSIVKTFRHSWDEVHERSPLLVLTHTKGTFIVTANHWIYRRNDRAGEYANFDRAGTLVVGDVLTMEDGSESVIERIERGSEYDFVYNLTVEGVHTYFADGVRVHNRNSFFIPNVFAEGDGGEGGGGGSEGSEGSEGSGGSDSGGGSDSDSGGAGGTDSSCDDMTVAPGAVGGGGDK